MKIFKVLLFPLVLAGLWALLAFRSPTTTYHLAPLLIAAAVPFAYRNAGGKSTRVLFGIAVLAGLGTFALAGLLAAGGALAGPSLLSNGGAMLESAVAAAAGTVVGFAAALLPG